VYIILKYDTASIKVVVRRIARIMMYEKSIIRPRVANRIVMPFPMQ